jgi:hypothetical protein
MVAFSRLLQFLDQVAASGGRNKCQASRFWFGNGMAANVSSASPPPLAAAAAVVVPFVILSTPRSVAGRSTSRGASSSALCIASGLDLDLEACLARTLSLRAGVCTLGTSERAQR